MEHKEIYIVNDLYIFKRKNKETNTYVWGYSFQGIDEGTVIDGIVHFNPIQIKKSGFKCKQEAREAGLNHMKQFEDIEKWCETLIDKHLLELLEYHDAIEGKEDQDKELHCEEIKANEDQHKRDIEDMLEGEGCTLQYLNARLYEIEQEVHNDNLTEEERRELYYEWAQIDYYIN